MRGRLAEIEAAWTAFEDAVEEAFQDRWAGPRHALGDTVCQEEHGEAHHAVRRLRVVITGRVDQGAAAREADAVSNRG